jgi:hypothetical protein
MYQKVFWIENAVSTKALPAARKVFVECQYATNVLYAHPDEDRRTASRIVFNIGSMSNSQIQAETAHSQQVFKNISFDPSAILGFVL